MTGQTSDVQPSLQQADATVRGAADRLREVLVAMAFRLDPFPYFLGSLEVQAVEAEPGGIQKADRGCVVVCPDGELYEFTMRLEQPEFGAALGLDRQDSIKPVQLPPEDYIPYAYHAIHALARLIEEQAQPGK